MTYRHMLYLFILMIAGCAAPAASRSDASRVAFDIQDKSYDEVWRAMVNITGRQLTVIENNKTAGTLKARRGVVMGPWGDVISFTIRPTGNGAPSYTIEMQSLDHPDVPFSTQDWVNTFIYRIKTELGQ